MTTIYDVLRRPILTEKSSHQYSKLHQFVFEVASDATKKMIKVNVMNMPAKRTRRARSRRLMVRKSGYKKAIITLDPGDTIEAFEGVR